MHTTGVTCAAEVQEVLAQIGGGNGVHTANVSTLQEDLKEAQFLLVELDGSGAKASSLSVYQEGPNILGQLRAQN